MQTLTGQIKDSAGEVKEWRGYNVSVSFAQLVDAADTTKIPLPSELVGDISSSGTFSLDLPDRSSLDSNTPIVVRVLAPAGEQLGVQQFTVPALADLVRSGTGVDFEVTPQAAYEVLPSKDPFLGTRPKLTGRVLDVTGERLIANRQILIFGIPRDSGAAASAAAPVAVARTDPQGYFTTDYPREKDLLGEPGDPSQFDRVWAVVAAARNPAGGSEIAIPLEDHDPFKGLIPLDVLLVVDVSDDALAGATEQPSDCACDASVPRAPDGQDLTKSPTTYSMDLGGGRCVNLTTPNRALEEFSFYTVVRTTDPQIQGLGDPGNTVTVPPTIVKAISSVAAVSTHEATTRESAPVRSSRSLTRPRTGLLATGIDPKILAGSLATGPAAPADPVAHAEALTTKRNWLTVLKSLYRPLPGRGPLTATNSIDWDSDEPHFYEATTIAHGHLLHFKQVWRADGYSLGDLLYSLPLAPGQKKQIAVVDWERREVAQRSESLSESEGLQNLLTRDRDISEIIDTTLAEHMHGDSQSLTAGYGQGQGAAGSGSYGGFNLGAVSGSAMGGGYSSAEANQDASRGLAANALQKIRDTTLQSASAVRNQRSTVIQTVTQGERVTVTTEVIANHNHCHAMTVEYFEVLRHFQVSQELADVQEALYVPLLMSPFDNRKALRWRDILFAYLRRPELGPGFDAIERIVTNYQDADYPTGTYAEEPVLSVEGRLAIEVRLPTPGDPGAIAGALDSISHFFLGSDPTVAAGGPQLQVDAVDAAGNPSRIPMEFTMVSEPADRTPLYVRMEQAGAWTGAPRREQIDRVHFTWDLSTSGFPDGTRILIRSGALRYRTAHLRNHLLFDDPAIDAGLTQTEAWVDCPLDDQEQRNLRHEDAMLARKLLAHLNEHLEYYHKAIWWSMDPDRRFMLLDGYIAPNSNGRSVASVVENRLIGFVGNSMVLPVGPGIHLDPSYTQDPEHPVDLLNRYAPLTPIPPMRISIPTRGVFAEAVLGECNSCEPMEETRFWRWDQAPTGDEPTPIQSPSSESRATPDPNLTAKDFPTPMIQIQNAPAEPDPTGLAAALKVIGTPNLFANITGLDQTQKNSLAAMQSALDAAKHFGDQAAALVQQQGMQKGGIDKSLQSINQAKKQNLIDDKQANDLSVSALKGLVGDKVGADKKTTPVDGLVPSVKDQVDKGGVKTLKATTSAGDTVEADFQLASLEQPLQQRCGFFGPNDVEVSEVDLRDSVSRAAVTERQNWLSPTATVLTETDNSQFGFLVSYWLARFSQIPPATLTALQTNAIGGAINYGQLLNNNPANLNAELARVTTDLQAGVPVAGVPGNINGLITDALTNARDSRQNLTAWSAVFVSSCVRGAAIQQGLEGMTGSTLVGRDEILRVSRRHADYVVAAYQRRQSAINGTYHAFAIDERSPQVGDIIIQDRQANAIGNVVAFNSIPATLGGGRELHGDIVVEATDGDPFVVTIGGNLSDSVRMRRYPLDADRKLVVDRVQLYVQEDANGNFVPLPSVNNTAGLHSTSTARIFALLSPVEVCAAVPGQPFGGGILA